MIGRGGESHADSDDEWLMTLLGRRSPRHRGIQSAQQGSDDSDDEWLRSLCRGSGSPHHRGSRGSPCLRGIRMPPQKPMKEHDHQVLTAKAISTRATAINNASRCGELGRVHRLVTKAAMVAQSASAYKTFSQLTTEFHGPTLPVPTQDSVVMPSAAAVHPSDVAGAFKVCLTRLAAWARTLGSTLAFKVGIAADPDHRYFNRDFGYAKESIWMFMDVVWQGPAQSCRTLERDLTDAVRSIPACYNEKPGGEGVKVDATHACFCYCVIAPCGDGLSLRAAHARRTMMEVARLGIT